MGARLAAWRQQRGISHGELAQLLGINRQMLWDWEHHGVPSHVQTILTLAMRELQRGIQSG